MRKSGLKRGRFALEIGRKPEKNANEVQIPKKWIVHSDIIIL
jgi:hypothetical protein